MFVLSFHLCVWIWSRYTCNCTPCVALFVVSVIAIVPLHQNFYPSEQDVFWFDSCWKRFAMKKSVDQWPMFKCVQMTNALTLRSGCLLLLIYRQLSQIWIICGSLFSYELQPSQFSFNQPIPNVICYWKLFKSLVGFVSNKLLEDRYRKVDLI